MILNYFGEDFDRNNCQNTCDNCEGNANIEAHDYTNHGKNIISLMSGISDNATFVQIVDVYRGSTSKRISKFGRIQLSGEGKGLSKDIIGRILERLMIDGIIEERFNKNAAGFINTYLKISNSSSKMKDPNYKLEIYSSKHNSSLSEMPPSSKFIKRRKK